MTCQSGVYEWPDGTRVEVFPDGEVRVLTREGDEYATTDLEAVRRPWWSRGVRGEVVE